MNLDWKKKQIGNATRAVKKRIEERNLLFKKGNDIQTMGTQIRSDINEIKKDTQELERLYIEQKEKIEERKKKGKKVPEDVEKEIEKRGEIVQLAWSHYEECKTTEKSTGKGQHKSSNFKGYTTAEEAPDALPDVDDPQFEVLRQNDEEINRKLDIIGSHVADLKNLAVAIGNEIELQEVMIDDATGEVEKTNAKLKNLNVRLKKQLDDVRKCDRFIIDFVCCILILAIIGYLYNVFSK